MTWSIAARRARQQTDLTVLAWVLEATPPELHAPTLPGESPAAAAARQDAAADIVDELVRELRGPAETETKLDVLGRAA